MVESLWTHSEAHGKDSEASAEQCVQPGGVALELSLRRRRRGACRPLRARPQERCLPLRQALRRLSAGCAVV